MVSIDSILKTVTAPRDMAVHDGYQKKEETLQKDLESNNNPCTLKYRLTLILIDRMFQTTPFNDK